jgi:hypothetical protein
MLVHHYLEYHARSAPELPFVIGDANARALLVLDGMEPVLEQLRDQLSPSVTIITDGQHSLLHRVFDPVQLIADMEQYPVTAIFMVPAMIMGVLQVPGVEQCDFSKLQQIFYGASPISETVLRRAIEVFQCDFIQMYGMTETTGTVVNLSPEDHRRALAGKPELLRSCGRASVGAEIKVMSPGGEQQPTGEVGEIWVRSETNMLGYYNLPDATAANLTDGWVHTGDAGYLDKEGYLFRRGPAGICGHEAGQGPDDRGHDRILSRQDRRLQDPAPAAAGGGTTAQAIGEDPQENTARALLGGQRAGYRLSPHSGIPGSRVWLSP